MPPAPAARLIAIDVGNSRIKLGEFVLPLAAPLPTPSRATTLGVDWTSDQLAQWLAPDAADCDVAIASVNRPWANRLVEALAERGVCRVRTLRHGDMPLSIDVSRPEAVGLDRLAHAVGANRLRLPGQTAIVVDHGSALTVDLVSSDGVFRGGAIMPGMRMAARALHEFTDGLPLVEVTDAPDMLERSTVGAIRFGLSWGAVGAVREVIARLSHGGGETQVFLTGGGAPQLAAILGQDSPRPPRFVPHLTLGGVAVAAEHSAAKAPP